LNDAIVGGGHVATFSPSKQNNNYGIDMLYLQVISGYMLLHVHVTIPCIETQHIPRGLSISN
jgi:hypothetical protein